MFTPAPPLPLQISSPSLSEAILPSPPSPSLSDFQTTEDVNCTLTMTPSILVVRFGDPVKATCSVPKMRFYGLGWEVSLASPELMMNRTLVWSVDKMTEWSIKPKCYALSEKGDCHIELPVIVYKPPDNVSISFVNHTGPMFEGHQYTLQCSVEKVAPVENLVVTFYRGRRALGQRWSKHNDTEKKPLTEIFSLDIIPSKEHNGAQYWCEAKLELGPEGPQPPPVVTSQKISTTVYFGPQLMCLRKLQVREGEGLSCEVRGNPQPLVTWFRDGQEVALPTHSSRMHAGIYTVSATGVLGQRNLTVEVEVEVLPGSGTTNCYNKHFLLAIMLIQMFNWL
ncbi:intercellular adhesion molecule 1-like [Anoplopoma fimbria]|uniref:intercellular adhesion molecule 1-like n=1 Tax=Anoplopoma fimbria TaxID=229290 RepID=UPI0023ED9283|nr:intercellular adhesion molecule 1-like [Anoplopoma fimbria]